VLKLPFYFYEAGCDVGDYGKPFCGYKAEDGECEGVGLGGNGGNVCFGYREAVVNHVLEEGRARG